MRFGLFLLLPLFLLVNINPAIAADPFNKTINNEPIKRKAFIRNSIIQGDYSDDSITSRVLANPGFPEDTFNRIMKCSHDRKPQGCRNLITASSSLIFRHFISYGVMRCLPKTAEYVSEQDVDDKSIIISHVIDKSKHKGKGKRRRYNMRLVFVEEEAVWKLDIPSSLRKAMGRGWREQLSFVENVHLTMRKEFGSRVKIDCQVLKKLVLRR